MSVKLTWREIFSLRDVPDSGDDYIGDAVAAFPAAELSWGDGDSAGNFDEWWCDLSRALAGTTNDDLDLQALTDGPRGRSVSFDKIKGILIEAVSQDLQIGTSTPPTNVWTGLAASGDVVELKEGTQLRIFLPSLAGLAVTGTNKVLRIRNPGATAGSYRLALLGVKS